MDKCNNYFKVGEEYYSSGFQDIYKFFWILDIEWNNDMKFNTATVYFRRLGVEERERVILTKGILNMKDFGNGIE